jgi:hypothetical protein
MALIYLLEDAFEWKLAEGIFCAIFQNGRYASFHAAPAAH